jgi:hypothetical protein
MHRAFCLMLSLAVSACSASETTMNTDNPATPAPDAQQTALESRYKRNPHPKQAYQITLTLADAPGPFESIEGFVNYEAPNCVYMLDRIAGVPATPEHGFSVEFTKVDETTYLGKVYADAMIDEDYFGKGICRWKLASSNVQLKATGAQDETNFIADISGDQLIALQSEKTYFLKEFYPKTELAGSSDFGIEDPAKRNPSIPESGWFTVALTTKAVTP